MQTTTETSSEVDNNIFGNIVKFIKVGIEA